MSLARQRLFSLVLAQSYWPSHLPLWAAEALKSKFKAQRKTVP
jgi:hypothetical protein